MMVEEDASYDEVEDASYTIPSVTALSKMMKATLKSSKIVRIVEMIKVLAVGMVSSRWCIGGGKSCTTTKVLESLNMS